MDLRDDLLEGLKRADAAGDTATAQHFADQLRNMAEPMTDYTRQIIKEGSKPTGRDLVADRMLEIGQGAGLGWGDEAAGVVGGIDSLIRGKNSKTGQDTFGGGYKSTVDQARRDLQNYEGSRPLEALGLNVVGGLPSIALAAPAVAGKVPLAVKMARAAKTGAAVGAVAGAGYGDGDLDQRIEGAAKGSLVGGLLSGLLPVVPAAVGGVKRVVQSVTKSAPDFAAERVANALTEDKVHSLDPSRPFIDQVPADSSTTQLAEQAALEGEGRKTATKFFKESEKAREGDMLGTVKQAVTDKPMYDVLDEQLGQRSQDAIPLYQKAYAAAYRRTPRLMDLLSRPSTGGALRAAYSRVLDDPNLNPEEVKAALGPIMGENPDELTDAQLQQRLTQAMGKRPVEFKVLDYVKRGMDAMVQDNPAAAWEKRQLRNAFREELKNINPHYQEALNAYAGPSAIMDAVTQGREFDRMDPEAINRLMGTMSHSEQQGFQVGVSRRLQDLASGAGSRQPGQNASLSLARGIEGNSVMQRRLQAALGSDSQSPERLLQRNGWRPQEDGSFTNSTKPGVQITTNPDGSWSAGQASKSGKSVSMMNAGHDGATLETFLTGKPAAVKPGASSVQDLIDMAEGIKTRADKQSNIIGNSATARRQAGEQFTDSADLAAHALAGPKGLAWYALRTKLAGNYLQGLTSARRAAVSKLLYSSDPADNQAAIDAIEKIRRGQQPTLLQQRVQQVGQALPVEVGAQSGRQQ